MSLIVREQLITDKQKLVLIGLGYYGTLALTRSGAAELIDEYYEEQRLDRIREQEELHNVYECFLPEGQLSLLELELRS